MYISLKGVYTEAFNMYCRMTAQNIKGPWPKKGTPLWFRAKKGHTGNEILGREKNS